MLVCMMSIHTSACEYNAFLSFEIFFFFLVALGLCCCVGFSLVAASGGHSLADMHECPIVVASLAVEHRL